MGSISVVRNAVSVEDTTCFVRLVRFTPEPDMDTEWVDPSAVRCLVSVGVICRGVKPT